MVEDTNSILLNDAMLPDGITIVINVNALNLLDLFLSPDTFS